MQKHVDLAQRVKPLWGTKSVPELARMLNVTVRQIHYIKEQGYLEENEQVASDNDEFPVPTDEQKVIVFDMWQRGYSGKAITHKLGLPYDNIVVTWQIAGHINLPTRRKPRRGYRRYYCLNPAKQVRVNGMQCPDCYYWGICDEKDEL